MIFELSCARFYARGRERTHLPCGVVDVEREILPFDPQLLVKGIINGRVVAVYQPRFTMPW